MRAQTGTLLLAALVAVFVFVDRVGFGEVVFHQAVLELFTSNARRFQSSGIFEHRRCSRHDLARAAGRKHHVCKLALRSFRQNIHLSHFPPNDARSFSTRPRRRALEQRSAVTMACTSFPARPTSSFTTQ